MAHRTTRSSWPADGMTGTWRDPLLRARRCCCGWLLSASGFRRPYRASRFLAGQTS
jgi:hypothetical protein